MHDLIIRGGTIADGSGQPTRTGDVAIDGSIVTAVGEVEGPARRVIDAEGLLVTPGWVDIHTHYDGQATWDPEVSPSGWHGVTTVVMGNCGVGFAPARESDRAWLIQLMEGVEDIPGTALAEGMNWNWETFGEYLGEVERTDRVLDVASLVPHGALRAYVLGEGRANDTATGEEIGEMAGLVRRGRAGRRHRRRRRRGRSSTGPRMASWRRAPTPRQKSSSPSAKRSARRGTGSSRWPVTCGTSSTNSPGCRRSPPAPECR